MMESAAPELHDAILLCVGVASVYLVVAVLQLLQLRRQQPAMIVAREPSTGSQLPLDAGTPTPGDISFPHQLKHSSIETDLKHLNLEIERLHTELQAVQHEVKLLRNESGNQGEAPVYNEAMSYARRGISAVAIASRCGISMGEAELVAAFARDSSAGDESARSSKVNEQHERQHDRFRAAA